MEDIDVIIRVTSQELYDNLKNSHKFLSNFKADRCLKKLDRINKNNEYRCTEIIRDEVGLVYKNYMVYCKQNEYPQNAKMVKKIYDMYTKLCVQQEQFMIGNGEISKYSEYKNIEGYIKKLQATYGGQTEKYLKKLSKKNLGPQKQMIKDLCRDKSKIISEKKRVAINLLQDKLDNWNNRYKNEKVVKILYSSERAEYLLQKMDREDCVYKKRIKFKTNFKDIEQLQENAIKKLRQVNFGIDVMKELKLNKLNIKYVDPFIIMMLCQDNYLDLAKIYLRTVSGNSNYKKSQLPFNIKYNINIDYKKGKMTPVRNEIMAMIAERGSLNVAYINNYKSVNHLRIQRVG